MAQLLPFRFEFTARAIEDLHRRLDRARWPNTGWDTGWSTGTNDAVLKALVRYWRREFDWFAQQALLNRRAHVRGAIDGDDIHAMLVAGQGGRGADRIPLLLLHGWPSAFVEFLDAADHLAAGDEETPGFDLVAPSLPGFVASSPAREPGMTPARMADRLHGLMRALGYERYGIQGGDWGAIVGSEIARRYPGAVLGLHLDFGLAIPPPDGTSTSEAEREWLDFRRRFEPEETGYSALQRTRPQTLAYGLHDSPVGLLAWMLEKFWAWTEHGDDLWETLDRDRVLTMVTLYWLTGSVLSASRVYYERAHADAGTPAYVDVPVGYARYPAEPWAPPREVMERGYRIEHYAEPALGGHFPAMEQPALYADDVAAFFRRLR